MHMLKSHAIKLFPEADVMKLLNEYELRTNIDLTSGGFMLAKQKVMEILERSLEKSANLNGTAEYKCPDSQAKLYKPLLCTIRQGIYEHYLLVVSISAAILGILKFLFGLRQRRILSIRAEQLYEQVCEMLEDNAMMVKNMKNEGDPWIVASWLRDHLLRPKERKDIKLWKKVEELLLEDSRIDQYPKLVKGESKTVLEWQVDGSLSAKMRAKRSSKTKPGSHVNITSSYQQREANMCT